MTRRLPLLFVTCIGLFTLASPANADTIHIGDLLHFTGSSGSIGGGAFRVDDTANGVGVDFLTFCLQRTEYLDYTDLFRVEGITTYADDKQGNDPISDETAWIFSSFRAGQLGNFSVDAIQAAIWRLEGEWTLDVGNSEALRAAAQAAVLGGWTNADVRVVNLFFQDGRPAQDQLVSIQNPEPTTALLLGSGLIAIAIRRRRRA